MIKLILIIIFMFTIIFIIKNLKLISKIIKHFLPRKEWETDKDYKNPPKPLKQTKTKIANEPKPIQLPYEKRKLLTPAENSFFKVIKEYLPNYMIMSKVRLEDIIYVKKGTPQEEFNSARGRIKSRHIDFVICDEQTNILLVIELNDKSHQTEDRIERDKFIYSALNTAGIKIIFQECKKAYSKDDIAEIITHLQVNN